jgi:predicted O-linked N-acetylglucosamine transferase (SPINDLY family)
MQPRDPAAPIAFACLNNVMKISDAALEAWANILREVPGSTILIQGEPGAHLDVMRGFFERGGVDPSRVDFAAKRSLLDYFELYHHIDIALDAFPYAGGTTTCDALWMGVPVVSLAGEIAVHRGAVSILTNLYLAELLTTSPQEYVKIAVELARDKERLSGLRGELRLRMEESNIMNPLIFTRDFEDALRQIWKSSISR